MIITCPHCQTRYQVAYEAIGATGRKVQCAHCQKAWAQKPVPEDAAEDADPEVRRLAEDALDEALISEERRVAAERQVQREMSEPAGDAGAPAATPLDPALIRKRQRAFSRRQQVMVSRLPLARLRRAARVLEIVVLAGILAGGYFGRVQIVEQFPAMAGLYAAIGLPVNVIGLEFDKLATLRTLRDGKDVLIVSADVVGVQPSPVVVPAVVVTLIADGGAPLYQWSVTPDAHDLMAGERTHFETQLLLPPKSAARVRLSFTGGGSARTASVIPPARLEER